MPLEGVSVHFLNMFCIILKEMRGWEIFDLPGSQQLLDAFSSDSITQQKWRCFGAIFEILLGHRKWRIYPNQKFFAEVFQITSRFVLANKKYWGQVHFNANMRVLLRWLLMALLSFGKYMYMNYNFEMYNNADNSSYFEVRYYMKNNWEVHRTEWRDQNYNPSQK